MSGLLDRWGNRIEKWGQRAGVVPREHGLETEFHLTSYEDPGKILSHGTIIQSKRNTQGIKALTWSDVWVGDWGWEVVVSFRDRKYNRKKNVEGKQRAVIWK